MKRKYLFLTTANLSTNPRLLKEVRLALEEDNAVMVIMFRLGNWSDDRTDVILDDLRVHHQQFDPRRDVRILNATYENKLPWFFWGVTEKLVRISYPFFKRNYFANAAGNTRRSLQLLLEGKKIKKKVDIICAHNLGALYPSFILSKKWKRPFIFDVEDYHPGENINTDTVNEKQRREYLMKTLLPHAQAMTSASPLIGLYALDLIGGHKNHQVILNGFSENDFTHPKKSSITEKNIKPLKLVWFSQKIGAGRGLEQLLNALTQLGEADSYNKYEITLIGELDDTFNNEVLKSFTENLISENIKLFIHAPLSQEKLHKTLSNFDVGLAIEFNTTDLNRQLCLTNKILAYAQTGLYILATDTPAQRDFLELYPCLGILSGQKVENIKKCLEEVSSLSSEIRKKREFRYNLSKALSWEKEAEKLQGIWRKN